METGDKMIKFGVMGAGKIAHRFCQAMNGINETLYAIASRDLERAARFVTNYGFAKAYGTYEELLADPEVRCVYVATPHGLHYEHVKLCLDAGKNVLCEKSFTLNHHEAQELFDLARAKGLSHKRIIGVHILKNIMIHIVTEVGLEFGSLVAF